MLKSRNYGKYIKFRKIASKLIGKWGEEVIVTQITFEKSNKEWLDDKQLTKTFKTIMLFISANNSAYFQRYLPITEIPKEGEFVIFLYSDDYLPSVDDMVKRGDITYRMSEVKSLKPADVGILNFAVLI
ncbi:hypothetical protein J3U11_11245 [Gilliamella sp. B2840]|uniref:hypothetical protein n=1 Tax=unclassified Gilliamella TaxID=2685620 RepID=UPI002269CAF6|nr:MULTISPECIES: hypothetical protein [unclassified Gilliamella]MCX8665980.1 hypothetical protein [Gilliamella sp. B2887]MCX8696559.1 hypothetical protein [Gilliamella sp. B2828]MCX8698304.1 hypothetical protein [Gilliamella sp. B3000]MCX8701649.1 hypothetical protein [Gilliamella sp. B2840]